MMVGSMWIRMCRGKYRYVVQESNCSGGAAVIRFYCTVRVESQNFTKKLNRSSSIFILVVSTAESHKSKT